MVEKMPFIPGEPPIKPGLLARFLPPIPVGIGTEWLKVNKPNGQWIIDPFGSSPEFVLEMARAGYNVLVVANNPITRFLLELNANSPKEEHLRAALADFAAARMGDERLELHLQELYKTTCSQCGQSIIADAFIWDRNSSAPHAKIYDCFHCGDAGEHPVNQSDIDLAESFSSTPIHKIRVLERIVPHGYPDRDNAEEALSVYTPRAVYALTTMINRLDGLLAQINKDDPGGLIHQQCLTALVLRALDKGNNLWSYPSGRARPKRLSASPRFREDNLWFALENAVNQIASIASPVSIYRFPFHPADAGSIILYDGPLRELNEFISFSTEFSDSIFEAVVTVLPRPNQAFWTLSALWSGWIWGPDAIGPFKSVFKRRRYDWAWHTFALNFAFRTMADFLPSKIDFFGLIGEAESNFISSAVIAAEQSNFYLQGMALRAESNLAELVWTIKPESSGNYQIHATTLIDDQLNDSIVSKVNNHLKERGEPAPYASTYTSALNYFVINHGINLESPVQPAEEFYRIDSLIEEILTFKHGYIRYGGGEKSPESSHLWHQEINAPAIMLSDQVESAVFDYLRENPGCGVSQIDHSICQKFPGLMTPAIELVFNCIESYCEGSFSGNHEFMLRPEDAPHERVQEVNSIKIALDNLGNRLGFHSEAEDAVIWRAIDEQVRLVFYVTPFGKLGNIVFSELHPPELSIIVLPGARANIIMYKLKHNPLLRDEIDKGWRFLKFRYLRHLMESPSLGQDNLDTLLGLDPLTESPAQMRLL